jgi:D-arginine dehydrogenase
MRTYDFAVIGAGIAGASAAYELQPRGRTLLIEREPLPGHHTTGRSAAFLLESYGTRTVQLMTQAGRGFLEHPPLNFAFYPLLEPRPVLWVARHEQRTQLTERMQRAAASGANLKEVDIAEARAMCPVLRENYFAMAVVDTRAYHIDVAGLLEAYLRGFRERGGEVVTRAGVTALNSTDGGWEIHCGDDCFTAGTIVNAAGAWAEEIGALAGTRAIGLTPLRRTAITFDPPADANIAQWPLVIDAQEQFYFKPEGAQLLASPCDETPSPPCDAVADDLSVAQAAERVMHATTLEISHLRRSWAGLRSFVSDRGPVIGPDPEIPGFFWLAGQGGFGIMTSSAAARATASLIVDGDLPLEQKALGLTPERLGPARLSQQPA